jgi:LPS-assembly protein
MDDPVPAWRALLARLLVTGAVGASSAFGLDQAVAQTAEEETGQPLVLIADRLERDDELGITTASGNVELAQAERIVIADVVTFNERDNVVTASGEVTILEPSGDVLFADYVELKDDLREGVIRAFRAKLTDGSRLAAASAERFGGNRTVMNRAVYSPCELCPTDRARAPLWQVKAKEVVHNQVSHDIAYYDAWLEFFGVPVAYTPYFEHADPTVKRRTGFLAPRYGNSTTLGYFLTTPYYVALAPWRDLTIEPTITTDEGPVLGLQYRELTTLGGFEFEGSITRPTTQDEDFGAQLGGDIIRGHLVGHGEFQLDPRWRTGFQLERASDETYLARYRVPKFASKRALLTRPYVEGFRDQSYFTARGYYFQSLDDFDSEAEVPLVLPLIDMNLVGERGRYGGFYTFDANGMALFRERGADSRRLSVQGGWHLPYISPGGEVYKLSATVRGDLYHVEDVVDPDDSRIVKDGITGRFVPELALEWRYPLMARSGTVRALIEPIVQAILSPTGLNPEKIPNEDSQDLEFDDTNVFASNRFTGLDRVEEGPRLNYGLKLGLYGANGGRTTALFGQTLRAKEDDALVAGSGLERNLSDYVGRILVSPGPYLDFAYRFRLDSETFSPHRNELDLVAGPEFLRLSLTYLRIEPSASDSNVETFNTREELLANAVLYVTPFWRLQAGTRQDLTDGGQTLSIDGSLTYEDECFLASVRALRRYTRSRDVEPDTSVVFSLMLKGVS